MSKQMKPNRNHFKTERLPKRLKELQEAHPNDQIEIWAEDEHRLGLQPIIRAVWVEKGSKEVTVPVKPGYEWFYLYAFVHPATGRSYWWILPYLNIEMFELALEDFAQEFGAGQGKQIILVVDRAGWHTSDKVKVPEGIHIELLPSKSPELQPAERLWKLSDETVANKAWDDIEAMQDEVWKQCQKLMKQPQKISQLTHYYWWPEPSVYAHQSF